MLGVKENGYKKTYAALSAEERSLVFILGGYGNELVGLSSLALYSSGINLDENLSFLIEKKVLQEEQSLSEAESPPNEPKYHFFDWGFYTWIESAILGRTSEEK